MLAMLGMFLKQIATALLNPVTWVVAALVAIVVGWGAYSRGKDATQAEWDVERAELRAVVAEWKAKAEANNVRIVTKYVERVTVVTEKADEIVREVPVLVAAGEHASAGWVCSHDRAAAGSPDAACDLDEGTGGAGARQTAEVVARNYADYHRLAEQVRALQEYVRGLGAQ